MQILVDSTVFIQTLLLRSKVLMASSSRPRLKQASGKAFHLVPTWPCLFVIILSVMFEDDDAAIVEKEVAKSTWSATYLTYDVEYVDDTLLQGLTTQKKKKHTHTHMLHQVELKERHYGINPPFPT